MDHRLVAWAAAVKARRRPRRVVPGIAGVGSGQLPALWLFTDMMRMPDPCAAARGLPKRLAGVVYRNDGRADRVAVGDELARICRSRGLTLVVAGDWRLARRLGAGLHLRGGRWPAGAPRRWPLVTSSAHNVAELVLARRAGARLVFLSPLLATASHPGASGLGSVRWSRLAMNIAPSVAVAALGGVTGGTARTIPRRADAVAGIGLGASQK